MRASTNNLIIGFLLATPAHASAPVDPVDRLSVQWADAGYAEAIRAKIVSREAAALASAGVTPASRADAIAQSYADCVAPVVKRILATNFRAALSHLSGPDRQSFLVVDREYGLDRLFTIASASRASKLTPDNRQWMERVERSKVAEHVLPIAIDLVTQTTLELGKQLQSDPQVGTCQNNIEKELSQPNG